MTDKKTLTPSAGSQQAGSLASAGKGSLAQQLAPAVSTWADHTTGASARRDDLTRDKFNALLGNPPDDKPGSLGFFTYTQKAPNQVTALDVKMWQSYLEGLGLSPSTVYAKISRVSSFYRWAIDNDLATYNPAAPARPKAPKAYQNESAQSLTDSEAARLLATVKAAADSGSLAARRDYAMLLFYFTTGMRRAEVIGLRAGDLRLEADRILLTSRVKGGDYHEKELKALEVKAALLDYLKARGVKFADLPAAAPLWVSFDLNPKYQGKALGSHGFVKNLKGYAEAAGLGDIHLHQTRHTVARWGGEEYGLKETQEILGHKSEKTTRIYMQRVAVKKDKISSKIIDRLGVRSESAEAEGV